MMIVNDRKIRERRSANQFVSWLKTKGYYVDKRDNTYFDIYVDVPMKFLWWNITHKSLFIKIVGTSAKVYGSISRAREALEKYEFLFSTSLYVDHEQEEYL